MECLQYEDNESATIEKLYNIYTIDLETQDLVHVRSEFHRTNTCLGTHACTPIRSIIPPGPSFDFFFTQLSQSYSRLLLYNYCVPVLISVLIMLELCDFTHRLFVNTSHTHTLIRDKW